jgi:hypothetical protein
MKITCILALVILAFNLKAQTGVSPQKQNSMKVAVWDTYVKSHTGDVLHFDIIVPDTIKDTSEIFRFGKEYLQALGEKEGQLTTAECQFCHIEEPTAEMLADIRQKGYYILEMESIPASMPALPTRRDMILHLRAHYPEYRFKNFRGISEEEVRSLVLKHQQ